MFNEAELGRNLAVQFYPTSSMQGGPTHHSDLPECDSLFPQKEDPSSILQKFENIKLRSSVVTGTFNPCGQDVAPCNSQDVGDHISDEMQNDFDNFFLTSSASQMRFPEFH